MSVGSAFDAYVKNYLAAGLGMSEAGPGGDLELEPLLESQVEPHNRKFAFKAGLDCFNQYKDLGACAELMKELEQAAETPSFESTQQATIGVDETGPEPFSGVPILGKPDLYFWSKSGALVIIDWKVNGYCSKRGASPRKGHVRLMAAGKPNKAHRDAQCMTIDGMCLNVAAKIEELDVSWATQLAMYGWVLGKDKNMVGKKIIAGIDQLACKPGVGAIGVRPVGVRVAQLRSAIGEPFQTELWAKCREIWSRIQSGDIFDEDNDATIARLDLEVKAFEGGSPADDWYTGMMRKHQF